MATFNEHVCFPGKHNRSLINYNKLLIINMLTLRDLASTSKRMFQFEDIKHGSNEQKGVHPTS